MISEITAKGFKLSAIPDKLLEHLVIKLERYLPRFAPDLPYISLIISRRLNKGGFFEGRMKLFLPKKTLVTNFRGRTLSISLRSGFEKIYKEFGIYKAKHFKGSSKYWNHESLRMPEFEIGSKIL